MTTREIRSQFLNYFKKNKHSIIASSPVVPHDDPTLLFTNAGMNQFKDVFLGESHRDYARAVTSQKCIRVGGKHNDLENVGHTSRHLTFFEMIGNFSFGDYFKEEAIRFSWEVSTGVFGFDPDRIWPTVFREDDEAFELWKKYVPAKRITRFNEKDNFWAMGDVGPCGPCSELLYDRGDRYGKGSCPSEDPSGERFLEYWNLVFMQYNKDSNGKMNPLPKPSIDTGAGLERVVSLKMNVDSVYETDILRGLIAEVENVSKKTYYGDMTHNDAAFRVIADHIRCLSFAIADGVTPSNVDRGYVLRKVLRRAVRYGRTLGLEDPFLSKILPRLVDLMGKDYKELKDSQHRIAEILHVEEEAFIRTLRRGGNMLNTIIDKAVLHDKIITGDDAFKLKDTYGFPLEEITLLAKDGGLTVDETRYQQLELEAKERSKSVHKVTNQVASENFYADYLKKNEVTEFLGYKENTLEAKIKGILVNGSFVDEINEGQEGVILLDKTPFYAEMGGQIGDTGTIRSLEGFFSVNKCFFPYKGLIAHEGVLNSGVLKINSKATAFIDKEKRQKIANNHTATHLLHCALQEVLGEHIKQAGSVVDSSRIRFDFSHHKALTLEELIEIENCVNEKIRGNALVNTYEIAYEEALKKQEIKQFFGDKYGAIVRVIDIGYSKELCGGTHTDSVGTVGLFKIAKESSIAAGIRRIEAVTGFEAIDHFRQNEILIDQVAKRLNVLPTKIIEKIDKLNEENKVFSLAMKNNKKIELLNIAKKLVSEREVVKGIDFIGADLFVNPEDLKVVADEVMTLCPSCIVILGSSNKESCQLIVRVSDDLVSQGKKANIILQQVAPIIGGSGGGKANLAQAGGKIVDKIKEVLAFCKTII